MDGPGEGAGGGADTFAGARGDTHPGIEDVGENTAASAMPREASGMTGIPSDDPGYHDGYRGFPTSSLGAGHLLLVLRELTGLSQRRLAQRMRTSQPTLARIEAGHRIPALRTLLRATEAAGFQLVLGLLEADADPPTRGELDAFALVGVLRSNLDDELADLVVLREPSVFDGPEDR